jgi:hypothetical protein
LSQQISPKIGFLFHPVSFSVIAKNREGLRLPQGAQEKESRGWGRGGSWGALSSLAACGHGDSESGCLLGRPWRVGHPGMFLLWKREFIATIQGTLKQGGTGLEK